MDKQCRYKRSDIWKYVQNRMSREDESEFQMHLLECNECRDELAKLRVLVHSIGKKEQRGFTLRFWVVAASVTCVLAGGTYWYYSTAWQNGSSSPVNLPQLKINPPILHNEADSINPQDTVPADTIQIHIVE